MRYRRLMWAEALELLDRAQQLRRQFFQTAESSAGPSWEPPVDLFETDAGLTIVVALPGVSPNRIEIGMHGGTLHIAGYRGWPEHLRCATIWRLEVPHGRFERRLELPPGTFKLRHHETTHGCLAIYLERL